MNRDIGLNDILAFILEVAALALWGLWAWSLAAVGEDVGSATRAVAWAVPPSSRTTKPATMCCA